MKAIWEIVTITIRCPRPGCRTVLESPSGQQTHTAQDIKRIGSAVSQCDECGQMFTIPGTLIALFGEGDQRQQ
jgi:hypothetical protein